MYLSKKAASIGSISKYYYPQLIIFHFPYRIGGDGDIPSISAMNSLDSPMTPCPSAVEYVTPVFAKNYQGVWRYVVQIPYEGYFTQTVEVVKCL